MFGRNELEKLSGQARKQLAEIEKVETALRTCEGELVDAEESHNRSLEGWQTAVALNEATKEPQDLRKLREQIPQLVARRTGLRRRLVEACGGLGDLPERYTTALREENQRIASRLGGEIAAAKQALQELQGRAIGLESVLDLGVPLVAPAERGSRVILPDGREVYQEITVIPPTAEDRAPSLLAKKLEKYVSKGKNLRTALREEARPDRDGKEADAYAVAAGFAYGRTRAAGK